MGGILFFFHSGKEGFTILGEEELVNVVKGARRSSGQLKPSVFLSLSVEFAFRFGHCWVGLKGELIFMIMMIRHS